jgi:elongation factor P
MSKVKAGNIDNGMYLMFNGEPYRVIKKKFVSPGKGSAFNRTKLQNVKSGSIVEHVFKSHDTLEEVEVESKEMQFLYKTADGAVFMDPRSYEQAEISEKILGDSINYLVAEMKIYVAFFENEAVGLSIPPKVQMKVTEAEEAVAGDRSSSGTKPVKTETGLVVQVPLFVKQGEKIIVDTQSGDYVSRA